jgi:hypothetical protein
MLSSTAQHNDDRAFTLLPIAQPSANRIEMIPLEEEFPSAHDISGSTLAGETVLLRTVDVEHDTVILFLSSGCSTCATFWSELASPIQLPPRTRLLVITQDAEVESLVSLKALAPAGTEVVLSSQAWEQYEVPGSPYVIAVNGSTGQVKGEGTGQSWAQIAELLARSTGQAGYLTGGPLATKPTGDAERESEVDRELIEAGLLPGDPRLYGSAS